MFRIDNPTAVPSLPLAPPVGTPGFWTNGDELSGLKPTHVDDWFLNMLQEELYTVVTKAGLTPNKADNTQLWQALTLRAPRMVLNRATTFYVNGNPGAGSDVADGLTAATAWATIQHACNYLLEFVDFNFQVVTLQIADCGTPYGSFNLAGIPVGCFATSQLLISGNLANPANVVVQSAIAGVPAALFFNSAIATVQGFTITNTGGPTGGNVHFRHRKRLECAGCRAKHPVRQLHKRLAHARRPRRPHPAIRQLHDRRPGAGAHLCRHAGLCRKCRLGRRHRRAVAAADRYLGDREPEFLCRLRAGDIKRPDPGRQQQHELYRNRGRQALPSRHECDDRHQQQRRHLLSGHARRHRQLNHRGDLFLI